MIERFTYLAKVGGLLECGSWPDGQSAADRSFGLENTLGRPRQKEVVLFGESCG